MSADDETPNRGPRARIVSGRQRARDAAKIRLGPAFLDLMRRAGQRLTKLREAEQLAAPLPTHRKMFPECYAEAEPKQTVDEILSEWVKKVEQIPACEARHAAKVRAGRALAIARARKRAHPAPGVVDLSTWKRVRELEDA